MKFTLTRAVRLALLLLFAAPVFAQREEVDTTFAHNMNVMFEHVEKSRVPHGLLLDYAMEFTNIENYNGTLTDTNYVHVGTYKSIYNTLLMAQVVRGLPDMHSPGVFRENWNSLREVAHIKLSGLCFKYSKFHEDALIDGKLTTHGNSFKDVYVGGVWQNPYVEQDVFAISPPLLHIQHLSFNVSLPDELFYTNRDDIASIEIDLGDGNGYQYLVDDEYLAVTYPEGGRYRWEYRITFQDFTELLGQSYIQVSAAPQDTASLMPASITAVKAWEGLAGSAKIQVLDAGGDGKITKPLIVAEGFDPAFVNPENPFGSTDILTFQEEAYDGTGNLPLELSEYDIIYVNWDNTFDFIQRNAYVLEAVINEVNATKSGNEPNVVLGQSMGGLIARYALRDMEKDNVSHDTRLYISHDAPHLGANIPIALQCFFRQVYKIAIQAPLYEDMILSMSDEGPTLYDVKTMLDAPSARQMLIEYIGPTHYVPDNSWHNAWQTELRDMGYPEETERNIAISNGSHCAENQDFNPGDLLLSMNGNIKPSWLTDILLFVVPLGNEIFGLSAAFSLNDIGFLLGVLPGSSKFNIDFWGKALPASGSMHIYHGKMEYKKKVLWIFNSSTTVSQVDVTTSNKPPLDTYPGGVYQLPVDLNGGSDFYNVLYNYNISFSVKDHFNFIPTPSALDIGKGFTALNNNDYTARYTAANPPAAPKDTPFDNFITSHNTNSLNGGISLNEQHISFNTRNGNWLALELNNTTGDEQIFDCTFICRGAAITGPDIVCSNGTFTVDSDFTYGIWSVSPSNAGSVTSGQFTNNAAFSFSSTYSGYITISVSLSSTCGSITLQKQVWRGKPQNPTAISGPGNVISGSYVGYVTNAPGATEYVWTVPQPFDTVTNFNTSGTYWQVKDGANTGASLQTFTGTGGISGTVTVKGCNVCGCTNTLTRNVTVGGQGAIGITPMNPVTNPNDMLYSIYPNPSSQYVYVSLRNQNNAPSPGALIKGELYDFYGASQGMVNITNNQATIDVTNLPSGIYSLFIVVDSVAEYHQLAVN